MVGALEKTGSTSSTAQYASMSLCLEKAERSNTDADNGAEQIVDVLAEEKTGYHIGFQRRAEVGRELRSESLVELEIGFGKKPLDRGDAGEPRREHSGTGRVLEIGA